MPHRLSSKLISMFNIGLLLVFSLPVGAQGSLRSGQNVVGKNSSPQINTKSSASNKPILISQATCSACGAELNSIELLATTGKKKDKSLLTDSLWGNLILEMAYQRDKDLQRLAKKMNIVSIGTLGAIGAVTGGTLAQGIVAMEVLNPSAGHLDSYTPGIIGTSLSSATILTIIARMYFNHRITKQVSDRQVALKRQVETILAHLESSDAKCVAAKKELTELIGERASREWIQLYQSSHQVAMTDPRHFSMLNMPGHMQ